MNRFERLFYKLPFIGLGFAIVAIFYSIAQRFLHVEGPSVFFACSLIFYIASLLQD